MRTTFPTTFRLALILTAFVTAVAGAVPNVISYQGRLTDPGGNPLDGVYSMTFRLYTDSLAGSLIFTEVLTVPVNSGLFSVELGNTATIPYSLPYTATFANIYLSIQIGVEPEMTPRRRLVSAPFALAVNSLYGAAGGRIGTSIWVYPTNPYDYAITAHGDERGGYFNASTTGTDSRGLFASYSGGTADAAAIEGFSKPADGWGIGAIFEGGFYGMMGQVVSPVGSDVTHYGVYGTVPGNASPGAWNFGVFGDAGGGIANFGVRGHAYHSGVAGASAFGVYGSATFYDGYGAWAGYFDGWTTCKGTLEVQGTLTKSAGSFRIDHPLDPENKFLQHSFVESPDMKNIYDGVVTTDVNGDATVTMPEWFTALNRDFRYQLTVIGQFAQAIVSEKLDGNRFSIKTDKPKVEVSWQVTGIRQDAYANAHRIAVEVDKDPKQVGLYIDPAAFGQAPDRQLHYWITKTVEDARQADAVRQKTIDESRRALAPAGEGEQKR